MKVTHRGCYRLKSLSPLVRHGNFPIYSINYVSTRRCFYGVTGLGLVMFAIEIDELQRGLALEALTYPGGNVFTSCVRSQPASRCVKVIPWEVFDICVTDYYRL